MTTAELGAQEVIMIFSDVQTHYINSEHDKRLVRYDIVCIDDDKYIVKVIDNRHFNRATPDYYTEVASFEITRDAYNLENSVGSASIVRNRLQLTFAQHILVKCQQHRDAMAIVK